MRQGVRHPAFGDDDGAAGIFGVKREAVGGVGGVHRDIGRARQLDAKRACHHVGRPAAGEADEGSLADVHAAQRVGDPGRAGGEVGIGELRPARDHGHGVGGSLRLRQNCRRNGQRAVVVACGGGEGARVDLGFHLGQRAEARKVGVGMRGHLGEEAGDPGGEGGGLRG